MNIFDDTYLLDPCFPIHVNTVWMGKYNQAQEHFHWHSFYEISCVLDGQASCIVNGSCYYLQRGDIAIFNCNEIHGWQMPKGDIRLLVVTFLPSLLPEETMRDILQVFQREHLGFRNVLSGNEGMVPEISACLNRIQWEWDNEAAARSLMIRAEMLRLLVMLERSFLAPKPDKRQLRYQKDMEKIRQALVFVDEHYMERITLEQVAGTVYLSRSYFSTLFHKAVNERFRDYLLSKRLDAARRLLQETDQSVLEIALASGFDNMSNFYRQYHKRYGERPGDYRKKITEG